VDLFDAIQGRRSIRRYRPDPVPRDDLLRVVEAGLWAPSGQNLQPVRAWILTDRDEIDTLSADLRAYGLKLKRMMWLLKVLVPRFRGGKGERVFRSFRERLFHDAPALILVGADRNASSTYLRDCTLAAMNMQLAAHALGLGSCYVGWISLLDRCPAVKRRLGIEPAVEIVDALTVGQPLATPNAPPRPDPAERTRWLP